MSAAPKVHHVTARQLAADRQNLAKARAAQKGKARTAKQIAASRANLAKARLARSTRKQGKKHAPVKGKKAAQAPLALWGEDSLHSLPVCAAVAVAASLQHWAGVTASTGQILEFAARTGSTTISAALEAAREYGLAGVRLAGFEPADAALFAPGLVYGIQLSIGYHAVLSTPSGMLSWNLELPLLGSPEEAWVTEWEESDD